MAGVKRVFVDASFGLDAAGLIDSSSVAAFALMSTRPPYTCLQLMQAPTKHPLLHEASFWKKAVNAGLHFLCFFPGDPMEPRIKNSDLKMVKI